MKTGIYDGVSNSIYHSNDGHYSSTLIKKMDVPALAKHHMESPHEYKDCYRIGSAIHACILEPSVFAEDFLTGISSGRRSKADRMEWARWFTDHGADGFAIVDNPAAKWNGLFSAQSGRHMVTPDEIQQIAAMAKSVAANKNAMQLLDGGRPEQSVYWEDDETLLGLKVRPDYLNEQFISDLKSCNSVCDAEINRAFANLGYGISQAMYQDGVSNVTGNWLQFLFIFIDKNPPHLCRVICLDDEAQERAWEEYLKRKRTLAGCLKSDEWPGIDDDLEYKLPVWAA